ncbi:MAG: amidohydrolase [Desulfovibrionaceae bacterium]|nr:amidohydrolase [Desulfovibrionaceae bacterium]
MRHCHTLLHAGLLVTQDAERRILQNASLAIERGIILDVGPRQSLAACWQAGEELDLSDCLVLPGLINAHTHVAMTFLRGLADDMPLMEWLNRRIFPVEARLTPETVRLGSLLGYAEMLRTGTTACLDMYIFEEAVFEAARTAGLRCVGGEGVFDFPSAACPTPEAALAATRALAERCQGEERLSVAVTPHSVYTTSPKTLTACRDLAQELNLPLHIHLAETRAETETSLRNNGRRPLAHCRELGLLEVPCTIAHAVDLEPDELDTLARCQAVVAHNPSSNMKLASGIAPVPAMLARGLRVGLGTDGAASNNRLNMFTEMGRAALLHKLAGEDPALLPAQAVLDMATLGGAAALHQPQLGSLAPGKAADCVALDLTSPNLQPLYRPVSHAVYAATGMETRLTMVAGEVLYRDGVFSRFDYAALLREAESLRAFAMRHADLEG